MPEKYTPESRLCRICRQFLPRSSFNRSYHASGASEGCKRSCRDCCAKYQARRQDLAEWAGSVPPPNPSGICLCGCGQPTEIAEYNDKNAYQIRGQPIRYVAGHQNRRPDSALYRRDPKTECWLWLGAADETGHGSIRRKGSGKNTTAHRYFYERYRGPIAPGLQIDHLCRNPRCVNPQHLEAVSLTENIRRGRVAKLTSGDVAMIKRLLADGRSGRSLAIEYRVSAPTIWGIKRGRTWRDVAPAGEDAPYPLVA